MIDGGKLELADLDGDGDRDLAVIRGNDRSVVVYDNDGPGHFSAAGAYATDASPWRLAAADLDGDGDLDLTTVGRDNSAPTATVLVNTRVGCPSDVSLSVAGGPCPRAQRVLRHCPSRSRCRHPQPGR